MKKFFLFSAIIISISGYSQSGESVRGISLSKKYTAKMLEDYQENAQTKIEDLFTYFQMLTDASLTADLKKEVVKNIKTCFQNGNPQVIDFTSQTNGRIDLNSLINKLLLSEKMNFKISSAWQNNSETALNWKINYSVTRIKSGESLDFKITQLVYLFEQDKAFGNSTKNVTVTFLGRME